MRPSISSVLRDTMLLSIISMFIIRARFVISHLVIMLRTRSSIIRIVGREISLSLIVNEYSIRVSTIPTRIFALPIVF